MTTAYYSIGEVSKRLNIPISTIRYYDKHGLLPFVRRTESGLRQFLYVYIDISTHIKCH
ncbi:MerR family DNA-binding transcriptional regulator [Streptococcus suis]|uniref:MerR family DNA-binding transcriptional regulator n=1 Tax=Streptococcus suis TaxID=1307 RepID=UPI003D0FCBC8